jgi:hypothetical protein
VAIVRWMRWGAAAAGRSARHAVRYPGPERDALVQSLKAAGAAVLAWALVGWWIRTPLALLAPWTALVLVDTTVYRSLRSGLQQFAVILVGAAAAALALAVTGGSTLGAMALALPFLVLGGTYRRLGRQGLYGATTALFVITYGASSLSALGYRLAETALGAVIGIGVNAFVLPPVHLRNVREQLRRLARESGDLLALIAHEMGEQGERYEAAEARDRAQRLDTVLDATEQARQWTLESLRANPGLRLRRRGPEPPPDEEDGRWQAVVGHLHGTVRLLSNATGEEGVLAVLPPHFLEGYAALAARLSTLCAERAQALREPGGVPGRGEAAAECWSILETLSEDLPRQLPQTAVVCGGLLTETRQLLFRLDTRQERDEPRSPQGGGG